MPFYKIFTNDRDKERGVPMYSCFRGFKADNDFHARRKAYAIVPLEFRSPPLADAVVLEWPPATDEAKRWLEKHVGPNL